MKRKPRISFPAKLLSNHNYMREVPVEGKHSSSFNFHIGYYDQYAAQIIRIGNCITLLSNRFSITADNFWDTNYFEDISRFVFWTFNESFRLKLEEKVKSLSLTELQRCTALLKANFIAYEEPSEQLSDEELQWCLVKNEHLKADEHFAEMYQLDKQNRKNLLQCLENRLSLSMKLPSTEDDNTSVPFLQMLRPVEGSQENTLAFIIQKLQKAGFRYKLFQKVPKLKNGKNKYGLNGEVAAMIDFFFQRNYFKKQYDLARIFNAYFLYSGNQIAKFRTFFSEFRHDNTYLRCFKALEKLDIAPLS